MASPENEAGDPDPAGRMLSGTAEVDDGQVADDAIANALTGLDDLDQVDLREHVERFENLHTALTDALNKAENLLSGTNSYGS